MDVVQNAPDVFQTVSDLRAEIGWQCMGFRVRSLQTSAPLSCAMGRPVIASAGITPYASVKNRFRIDSYTTFTKMTLALLVLRLGRRSTQRIPLPPSEDSSPAAEGWWIQIPRQSYCECFNLHTI